MPLSPSPDPVWATAILIAVFTTKHYIADFLLQTNWVAAGKEGLRGWLLPLAAHAAGHGILTLLIAAVVAPRLWWLALVDFGIHFAIDRGKSTICHAAHLTPQQKTFWWLLGLDQYAHQLTNIGLSVAIVLLKG